MLNTGYLPIHLSEISMAERESNNKDGVREKSNWHWALIRAPALLRSALCFYPIRFVL